MRLPTRAFAMLGAEHGPTGPVQNHRQGIILALSAIFAFSLMDATAKTLAPDYHIVQILFARFAVNMIVVLALLNRQLPRLARSRAPWLQLGRGATQLASVGLFFTSLQFLGLAEATALMDLNPVLITLGAALFLGEHIGSHRIAGIIAAMVGAMIILRPGLGVFQLAGILPMMAACTYAAGGIMTRLVRHDPTGTSMLWSTAFGTVVTAIAMPFFWQPVASATDLLLFVGIGFLGTAAQFALLRAVTVAEASTIAPFGYVGLLCAGLWGWLFWGTVPDLWTVVGASVIVAAGIYVWLREKRRGVTL